MERKTILIICPYCRKTVATAVDMCADFTILCPFCAESFAAEISSDGTVIYLHNNPDYPKIYRKPKNETDVA